ncbi:MAG: hypothetical protein RL268_2062, partial [Pseudomonadota bacterium]
MRIARLAILPLFWVCLALPAAAQEVPKFTDETAACMVWSETIMVMLLTHAKWKGFTTRPICPAGSSEVSLALNCEDRAEVDRLVAAAAAHGGRGDINPAE